VTDRSLAVRLALLYAALFASLGVYVPFFPVWLEHQGLTPTQIGLAVALSPVLRVLFLTPVTHLADRLGRVRDALALCSLLSLAGIVALGFAEGVVAMLAIMVVLALVWNPVLPLAEGYALNAVRQRGLDFSRMRIWGSVAFVLVNLAAGWIIGVHGPAIIVWLVVGLVVLPCLLIPWLPQSFGAAPPPRARKREWTQLFKDPVLVLAVAGSAMLQATHAAYYTFGSSHWRATGIADATIGALWATGVIAEILLFLVAPKLVGRVSPFAFLGLGVLAGVVRWTATAFDPPLALLFTLQALHALTFAGTYLGLMALLTKRVPPQLSASAQGLNAVAVGALMALATLVSGPLWEAVDAQGYLLMSAMSLLAGGLVFAAWRRASGGFQ
jgi:MFS transporter, PPP family, 3-phenylpropionic acid transporter